MGDKDEKYQDAIERENKFARKRIETLERALRDILTSAELAGDYDFIAEKCREALGGRK